MATTSSPLEGMTLHEAVQNNLTDQVLPSIVGVNFSIMDYGMFIAMMLMSALIGVYYGCYKKQDSVSEYLLGGQTMGVFPIAMSLIASNVSGITMLGVPSEMYQYGTQFFLIAIMVFPAMLIVMYGVLPMFYNLAYTSSFEYLEHRFNRQVRQLSSVLFTIGLLLYMPVVIYVPCLALNQVSGISIHIISPAACIVCVFYTSLGGLKAVVWTDALQLLLLCMASIVVMILGTIRLGGVGTVFERVAEGERFELFNMDPSPYARCTFWNLASGALVGLVAQLGTSPSSVQRYLCVPTLGAARRVAFALALGYFITKCLSCATGLIIYATYYYCDPLAVKIVRKQDQLVPYFVMDVASSWPGLPGLFVAGVFSAALSTMSAGLNTLSGTLFKDFIEKWIPVKVSEKDQSTYMKIISLTIGGFCVVMIFLVEKLGGVLQLAITLGGVTGGASFGLFALGMFFPWANTKGAFAGAVASLAFMAVTVAGNSVALASGALRYPTLPTRVDGCSEAVNATLAAARVITSTVAPALNTTVLRMPHDADVFPLFKVSYFYFAAIGALVTVVVGVLVSFMTGAHPAGEVDPDLLSPWVSRFTPKKNKATELHSMTKEEYKSVCQNGD